MARCSRDSAEKFFKAKSDVDQSTFGKIAWYLAESRSPREVAVRPGASGWGRLRAWRH